MPLTAAGRAGMARMAAQQSNSKSVSADMAATGLSVRNVMAVRSAAQAALAAAGQNPDKNVAGGVITAANKLANFNYPLVGKSSMMPLLLVGGGIVVLAVIASKTAKKRKARA